MILAAFYKGMYGVFLLSYAVAVCQLIHVSSCGQCGQQVGIVFKSKLCGLINVSGSIQVNVSAYLYKEWLKMLLKYTPP